MNYFSSVFTVCCDCFSEVLIRFYIDFLLLYSLASCGQRRSLFTQHICSQFLSPIGREETYRKKNTCLEIINKLLEVSPKKETVSYPSDSEYTGWNHLFHYILSHACCQKVSKSQNLYIEYIKIPTIHQTGRLTEALSKRSGNFSVYTWCDLKVLFWLFDSLDTFKRENNRGLSLNRPFKDTNHIRNSFTPMARCMDVDYKQFNCKSKCNLVEQGCDFPETGLRLCCSGSPGFFDFILTVLIFSVILVGYLYLILIDIKDFIKYLNCLFGLFSCTLLQRLLSKDFIFWMFASALLQTGRFSHLFVALIRFLMWSHMKVS